MKIAHVLVACVAAAAQAGVVTVCSDPDPSTAHLKNAVVTVSPDPPVKGQPLTITASGSLDEAITAGNIAADLNVKALGIINEPIKSNTDFTLSPGLESGDTKVTLGPFDLPSLPGSVELKGKVTQLDSKGELVVCIDIDLTVGAESDVQQLEADPVSDCGTDSDHLHDRSITIDGDVTTVKGTLDEDVAAGELDIALDISASIIKIPINVNIPFTLSPPVKKGPISATFTKKADESSSDEFGLPISVKGTIKANDAAKQEITCIAIDQPALLGEEAMPAPAEVLKEIEQLLCLELSNTKVKATAISAVCEKLSMKDKVPPALCTEVADKLWSLALSKCHTADGELVV